MSNDTKCESPSGGKSSKNDKKAKKPQLRGLHTRQTVRHIIIGSVLSVLSGVAFYFLNNDKRKKAYEEFYKNYDANASFERMLKAGIFSSIEPEKEEEPPKGKKEKGFMCF